MSRRTVLLEVLEPRSSLWLVLLLGLLALAGGSPTPEDVGGAPLPFLQFTNGGVRVNFGGYHAQAGLGGFLTGSRADGGLHASAGTPSGAHASAGLGGILNGGPAGGLHARAGLGNGGPEAAAGLAGTVAGPRPRGTLYANSYPGNFAGHEEAQNENDNSILIPKRRDKNVQIIARPKKAAAFEQEIPSSSSSSSAAAAVTNAEKTAFDGGEEAERIKHPARWYFRKRLHERVGPVVSKTSHNAIASPPEHAETTPVEAAVSSTAATGAFSKATVQGSPTLQGQPSNVHPQPSFTNFVPSPSATGSSHKYKTSTLFDDIFNIPISALNAVNQLLKNHVGRK